MQVAKPENFAEWRDTARALWARQVPPHAVRWQEKNKTQSLFDPILEEVLGPASAVDSGHIAPPLRLSRFAIDQLQAASMFRSADRWAFLYQVLWRLGQADKEVLSPADPDGGRLTRMAKAVWRDIHHMHAFVRFREIPISAEDDTPESKSRPRFVAWYEPEHDILHPAGEHFANRMGALPWLIVTPIGTIASDGRRLEFGPPAPKPPEGEDAAESLWLTYYRSTFNPARLNLSVMQSHMPQHYWKNLPEAQLIPELVSSARAAGRLPTPPQTSMHSKSLPGPAEK